MVDPNSSGAARRYTAFLSYRHADNRDEGRRWAEWLHQILETYEVPRDIVGTPNLRGEPIPASLYPVFRDEAELPANAELSVPIRAALANSAALVVLCSPRAVESRFVSDEITIFKELGKSDRILALILDGEPNADDPGKTAAGLDPALECFPRPIRFGVQRAAPADEVAVVSIDWSIPAEPIAADVRPGGLPGQGYTSAAAWRAALEKTANHSGTELRRLEKQYAERLDLARLKIISGLLAVPLGTLTKRDAAYRAQKFRRLATVFGLITLLAVAAGLVAIRQSRIAEQARGFAETQTRFAERESTVAKEQRARAEEQTGIANTQQRLAEKESAERAKLLDEAARSDRLTAQKLLAESDESRAFAHLQRASRYAPASSLAAEMAMPAILAARNQYPRLTIGLPSEFTKAAIYTPDGSAILAFSSAQQLQTWNPRTGALISSVPGPGVPRCTASFSPDGRILLTVTEEGIPAGYDVRAGVRLPAYDWPGVARSIYQFSEDSRFVTTITAFGGAYLLDPWTGAILHTFDPADGKIFQTLISPDGAYVVLTRIGAPATFFATSTGTSVPSEHTSYYSSFSPDSRTIAGFDQQNRLCIWDLATGALVRQWEAMARRSDLVAFSPDGQRILINPVTSAPEIRDAAKGTLISTLVGFRGGARNFLWSPDGLRVLVTSFDDPPSLWDARTGLCLARLLGQKTYFHLFSPDGRDLLTFSSLNICISDARPGAAMGFFGGISNLIGGLAFSPDGKNLFTSSFDGKAFRWDIATGVPLTIYPGDGKKVSPLALSPDGSTLALGVADGTTRLWDVKSGTVARTLIGHTDEVLSLAFSPDGCTIVTGGKDNTVRTWDVATGAARLVLKGHANRVMATAFSPDGARILSGALEPAALLWDAATGESVGKFTRDTSNSSSLAYSPDGSRILIGSWGKNVRLWDAASGKLIREISADDQVDCVAISPDGLRYAIGDKSGKIYLWDGGTTGFLCTFKASERNLTCLAFSPDGRKLASGSWDATALIWDLVPADVPPPGWFTDFLSLISGSRFDASGILEDVPAAELLALRARLRATDTTGDPPAYGELLQWWLRPPSQRYLAPYSIAWRDTALAELINRGAVPKLMAQAYLLDPGNPLIHLMLSATESDPITADFLRRYSLDRLPDDPALQIAAAAVLSFEKQPAWALAYVQRALANSPDNPAGLRVLDKIQKELHPEP